MTAGYSFRGYAALTDVKSRIAPLAQSLTATRPSCRVLTVRRPDLEVIARWPEAAGVHGFYSNDGVWYWQGFELRADHGAAASPDTRVTR